MPNSAEMQERLGYERNLNLKLREAQQALEAAVELHQQEILRLRSTLDKTMTFSAHIETEYEKLKVVVVEISRNRIHGKPTVAAELAQAALR